MGDVNFAPMYEFLAKEYPELLNEPLKGRCMQEFIAYQRIRPEDPTDMPNWINRYFTALKESDLMKHGITIGEFCSMLSANNVLGVDPLKAHMIDEPEPANGFGDAKRKGHMARALLEDFAMSLIVQQGLQKEFLQWYENTQCIKDAAIDGPPLSDDEYHKPIMEYAASQLYPILFMKHFFRQHKGDFPELSDLKLKMVEGDKTLGTKGHVGTVEMLIASGLQANPDTLGGAQRIKIWFKALEKLVASNLGLDGLSSGYGR